MGGGGGRGGNGGVGWGVEAPATRCDRRRRDEQVITSDVSFASASCGASS